MCSDKGRLPLTAELTSDQCSVLSAHSQCTLTGKRRVAVTSDWPARSLPPLLFFSLTAKKACNEQLLVGDDKAISHHLDYHNGEMTTKTNVDFGTNLPTV